MSHVLRSDNLGQRSRQGSYHLQLPHSTQQWLGITALSNIHTHLLSYTLDNPLYHISGTQLAEVNDKLRESGRDTVCWKIFQTSKEALENLGQIPAVFKGPLHRKLSQLQIEKNWENITQYLGNSITPVSRFFFSKQLLMANVRDNTMGQPDFWAHPGLPFLRFFPLEEQEAWFTSLSGCYRSYMSLAYVGNVYFATSVFVVRIGAGCSCNGDWKR